LHNFEWIVMDIKLLKDIPPWQLKGLNVCMIGFLIICVGFLLFVFGLNIIGRAVLYSGFLVGFVGMGIHL
jgi:hypothetical protein